MEKQDYINKFRRCILEYTYAGSTISEEGDEDMGAPMGGDPMGGGDPNAMGGDPMGGGDPNAMGGDPMGGGDPNAMGGDPMGGGDPNAMGGDPAQGPEGFAPQGADQNAGLDGMGGGDPNAMGEDPMGGGDPNAMGGDPNAMGGEDGMQEDDEVIDVDELIKSQEDAEKKIDAMNSKFERLMGAVETLVKQNQNREDREMNMMNDFKSEMEKRNPTPMQRMTMRSAKSAPYDMTPSEYANNYMPDNYSADSDNNGEDDPQYKITKGDIDSFTDYNSIAKELDIEHQGLKDILGY